jgi:hypothetical protein
VLEVWNTARLVRESGVVVQAVVGEQQAVWDGKLIFTDTRLEVKRFLVGGGPAALWVRQLGGRIGDRWMHVSGTLALSPGQEVLLFLVGTGDRRFVAGMAQGGYRLLREASGVTAERAFPHRRLSLSDLEREIRAAVRLRRR